jgi:hypothetical protein
VASNGGKPRHPIYGQGMTVAALQALALRPHLRPGRGLRTRSVLRALARVTDAAWELTIGADLAVPGVEGRRTLIQLIAAAYITRLQATTADNPALARAFVRVTGLVDPPEALLRPTIALQVFLPHVHAARSAERPSTTTMR